MTLLKTICFVSIDTKALFSCTILYD